MVIRYALTIPSPSVVTLQLLDIIWEIVVVVEAAVAAVEDTVGIVSMIEEDVVEEIGSAGIATTTTVVVEIDLAVIVSVEAVVVTVMEEIVMVVDVEAPQTDDMEAVEDSVMEVAAAMGEVDQIVVITVIVMEETEMVEAIVHTIHNSDDVLSPMDLEDVVTTDINQSLFYLLPILYSIGIT